MGDCPEKDVKRGGCAMEFVDQDGVQVRARAGEGGEVFGDVVAVAR